MFFPLLMVATELL